jgi:hypothetical protein
VERSLPSHPARPFVITNKAVSVRQPSVAHGMGSGPCASKLPVQALSVRWGRLVTSDAVLLIGSVVAAIGVLVVR